jgi:hypothetical protein
MNLYTHEKLMELERERLAKITPPSEHNGQRRTIGPLATFSGRALRRVGEGLESWGAPPCPPDADQQRHAHHGM